MKNCSVCHAEVQDDAKFCPECGASLLESNDTSTNALEEKNAASALQIDALEETDQNANRSTFSSSKERWYYVEDGQSVGPFNQEELLEKLNQKEITPETYIWSKGMKEWTQLHNTDLYKPELDANPLPVAEVIENGVITPIEAFENPALDLDLSKDSNETPPEPIKVSPLKDSSVRSSKEAQTPPPHKNLKENDSQDWYYVVNGRTVGPFSEAVMIRSIHQGVVDGSTYVWKEGYLDWQHLKDTPLAVHLGEAVRPNETVLPGQTPYYSNYQPGVPVRNIILYLFLTIVTCGIFEFIWLYMIASDLNKLNAQKGKKPIAEPLLVVVFSLITCNIYTIYYLWKAGNDVYELSDRRLSNNSMLLAILSLFVTPASLAILQDQINALVESGDFH